MMNRINLCQIRCRRFLRPYIVDNAIKWPARYPGLWKGNILGSSIVIGNNASTSNAIPMYNAVLRGSALNAWIYPDAEDAAHIVSANIGRANMSSAEETADGFFTFINHPFKNTPGGDHPAGREDWVNRVFIDAAGETIYMQSNAELPDSVSMDEVPALLKVLDPVRIAEAFDAKKIDALADTGAETVTMMSKV